MFDKGSGRGRGRGGSREERGRGGGHTVNRINIISQTTVFAGGGEEGERSSESGSMNAFSNWHPKVVKISYRLFFDSGPSSPACADIIQKILSLYLAPNLAGP